jgi:hypothetical protein
MWTRAVPDLISIGGASRSGSTLMGLLLGRVGGFVNVGELRYVWSRGYRQNMLCGCGVPFRDCSFWRSVIERAYGRFDSVPLPELRSLHARVGQIWHLPALVSRARTGRFERDVRRCVAHLAELCDAIRSVSGASTIVDSSKLPSFCYLLGRTSGGRCMLVHLVRDSRAVAFSFMRRKRKPDIHWTEAYMKRFSPLQSAMDWNGLNLAMELIRIGRNVPCRYLRYEDLADDAAGSLSTLLPELPPDGWTGLDGDAIPLEPNHTVSGNPLRFTSGELRIRPDTEWRLRMKNGDRSFVTAATLPLLIRYGYLPASAAREEQTRRDDALIPR